MAYATCASGLCPSDSWAWPGARWCGLQGLQLQRRLVGPGGLAPKRPGPAASPCHPLPWQLRPALRELLVPPQASVHSRLCPIEEPPAPPRPRQEGPAEPPPEQHTPPAALKRRSAALTAPRRPEASEARQVAQPAPAADDGRQVLPEAPPPQSPLAAAPDAGGFQNATATTHRRDWQEFMRIIGNKSRCSQVMSEARLRKLGRCSTSLVQLSCAEARSSANSCESSGTSPRLPHLSRTRCQPKL